MVILGNFVGSVPMQGMLELLCLPGVVLLLQVSCLDIELSGTACCDSRYSRYYYPQFRVITPVQGIT